MLYAFDKSYGTCKFVWYSVVHTPVNKSYLLDYMPHIFVVENKISPRSSQTPGIC